MKRIVISILLLMAALFISKPFPAESSQLYPATSEQNGEINRQNYLIEPNSSGVSPFLAAGCPCDTPAPNPTIGSVIVAAVAVWLTMASLIYGSHFIAGLIAG
ncbi:MAG: hypothetical protein HS114_17905 [Anaerolineales bacterium]|nr:hypothetical protein [Anaerolineales bacterium]